MAQFENPNAPAGGGPAKLHPLLSWFNQGGGWINKLRLACLKGEMGLSVFTTEEVRQGELVMSIPLRLCMTVESARESDLRVILDVHPELMETPDEVLALHLMRERRKGEQSFWKEYIRTLPDDVDIPQRWSDSEKALLSGTMVGTLSRLMEAEIHKDWSEKHVPLKEEFPSMLSGVTFGDYVWALSSIWSRAFDYHVPAAATSTEEPLTLSSSSSHRAMVPVINAANHHPSAATSLAEMMEFAYAGYSGAAGDARQDEDTDSTHENNARNGQLLVRSGRDYGETEQFYILYGRYSNAKLLYSYGFVMPDNPYGSLDYWIRIPPSDPGFTWKQALLDKHPLTERQTYDFAGTLRAGGWISPALMAYARVGQLTLEERSSAANAFDGKMVTTRNERAAIGSLLAGLRRKSANYNSSIQDERNLIAQLEHKLLGNTDRIDRSRVVGSDRFVPVVKDDASGTTSGFDHQVEEDTSAPEILSPQRQLASARVRLEERCVLADAIQELETACQRLP